MFVQQQSQSPGCLLEGVRLVRHTPPGQYITEFLVIARFQDTRILPDLSVIRIDGPLADLMADDRNLHAVDRRAEIPICLGRADSTRCAAGGVVGYVKIIGGRQCPRRRYRVQAAWIRCLGTLDDRGQELVVASIPDLVPDGHHAERRMVPVGFENAVQFPLNKLDNLGVFSEELWLASLAGHPAIDPHGGFGLQKDTGAVRRDERRLRWAPAVETDVVHAVRLDRLADPQPRFHIRRRIARQRENTAVQRSTQEDRPAVQQNPLIPALDISKTKLILPVIGIRFVTRMAAERNSEFVQGRRKLIPRTHRTGHPRLAFDNCFLAGNRKFRPSRTGALRILVGLNPEGQVSGCCPPGLIPDRRQQPNGPGFRVWDDSDVSDPHRIACPQFDSSDDAIPHGLRVLGV